MSDRESLLRKVRALLALAKNNTDRHEAEAAAAKAQELVLKYGLKVDPNSQGQEQRDQDPLGRREVPAPLDRRKKLVRWRCALAAAIARGFLCCVVVVEGPGSPRIGFVGRRWRVLSAVEAWSQLCPTLQKAADKSWEAHRRLATSGVIGAGLDFLGLRQAVAGRGRAQSWKEAFLVEATASLSLRFQGNAAQVLGAEHVAAALAEAEALTEEYYPGSRPEGIGGGIADPFARAAGSIFGKRVDL